MQAAGYPLRASVVALGLGLAAGFAVAQAPAPPQAGLSLAFTLGPAWNSNPLELPGRRKGDGYFGLETNATYRWVLWEGGALALSGIGYSEQFFRESSAGLNRLGTSMTFSQRWQGTIFTLGIGARTATNQALTRHDSASQDVTLGISRSFTLMPDVSLTLSSGASRRFFQDGSEDQVRARAGATLARKWGQWTFSLGAGFSYTLEDKTPILPRINDRAISASVSASYEWAKDRDISAKLSYSRTYSSLPLDRFKVFSFAPQIAATFRF
ncbi:MAG: hypothetical protein FD175_2673 [Beijerinckiaceae bacterium]|nr:MAG: hypothetical protein FD175_2673 [Beijerinckiaceae bacterium]